jgi:hypothetical protein
MYKYFCYECGANLDPGEKCDCGLISKNLEAKYSQLLEVNEDGQYTIFQELKILNED